MIEWIVSVLLAFLTISGISIVAFLFTSITEFFTLDNVLKVVFILAILGMSIIIHGALV